MKDDVETLWRTYNLINEWIKFSDAKATALLAINGVILSIILSNLPKTLISIQNNTSKFLIVSIIFLIMIYTIFSAILYSISCLYPIMDKKDGNELNLIYYKDIAEKFETSEEYLKYSEKIFDNDIKLKKELSKEIFENSNIANIKYKKIKYAIYSFGIVIISMFCIILFIF